MADSSTQVPEIAQALAEACTQCARHSYHLLMESWIDGSFPIFDYFNSQYLFSAATILAISSFLPSNKSQSDGEDFESAVQLIEQLKQNGNYGAHEFTRHFEAMKVAFQSAPWPDRGVRDSETDFTAHFNPTGEGMSNSDRDRIISEVPGSRITTGMALAMPTLQELQSQPDLGFIDASMYQNGEPQGFYWHDFGGDSWM
jgi:proline utilization trans-activator